MAHAGMLVRRAALVRAGWARRGRRTGKLRVVGPNVHIDGEQVLLLEQAGAGRGAARAAQRRQLRRRAAARAHGRRGHQPARGREPERPGGLVVQHAARQEYERDLRGHMDTT